MLYYMHCPEWQILCNPAFAILTFTGFCIRTRRMALTVSTLELRYSNPACVVIRVIRTLRIALNTRLWLHVAGEHSSTTIDSSRRLQAALIDSVFVQTLKHCFPGLSRTCKDQIPGFSRTRKTSFSRTYQDTLRLQTWLHEVKHCTYQISFRCNCITVSA